MAVTINAKGTSESTFSIGKQGPKLKNNAGVIEIRNSADSAFAELKAATGSTSDGLATKAYVDSVASGLNTKNSVRVVTNAASDLTGFTYTAATDNETVGAAPWTSVTTPSFDSVSLSNGDRVLIKDSSDAKGNGIFTFDSGASTFVRAADADNSPSNEVSGGMFTFIGEGTNNADTGWVMSSPTGAATLGTDNLDFIQFSSAGVITGGDGLVKNGFALDVVGTTDRISVSADAIDIASSYVGQSSITTLGTISGFTSTGIDDNASATRLTLSNTANTLIAANGSGGAGGSVSLTGGTGDAGEAGGAIVLTSGTGGTASGSGGVISLISGDGPNNGGAINITTGVTSGSGGVGGAINITTGDGGSNAGVGGALNLTAGNAGGALSSSDGGAITITTGTGGSGTGAGGNITLAPGIAGSGGSAADGAVIISSANIGIGTPSPTARLHISDNTATSLARIDTNQNADITVLRVGNVNNGSAARTRIQMNNNFANSYFIMSGNSVSDSGAFGPNGLTIHNDGTAGIRLAASHASGDIKFFTAGTSNSNERMVIDSAGFVGIGESVPLSSLHIQDDSTSITSRFQTNQNLDIITVYSENTNTGATAAQTIKLSNGTADATLSLYSSGFTPSFGKDANGVTLKGGGAGGLTLLTTNGAALMNFITGTGLVATLTSGRKMGIRLTDPDAFLHVRDAQYGTSAPSVDADEFAVENFGNAGMTILSTGLGSFHFGDNSNTSVGKIVYDHSDNHMAITVNTAEAMRIHNTGNVSIGTIAVGSKFHVKDAAANTIAQFSRDDGFGDSTQDCGIVIGNSGDNEGKLQLRYFNSALVQGQLAVIEFLPRNAADDGSKIAGRIIFTNDSDSSSELQLSAPNNAGTAMIVSLDGDDQVWAPTTSGQLSLGRTGKRWNHLWADGNANIGGDVIIVGDIQANNYAGRNKIINGNIDCWQRGTSFTPAVNSYVYGADRFATARFTNANYTVSRQGSIGKYRLRVQRDSATTDTDNIEVFYAAESADVSHMAGKVVTLSLVIKAGANYSHAASAIKVKLISGTGTDQAVSQIGAGAWTTQTNVINATQTITTTETKYSFTTSALGSTVSQLAIRLTMTPVGTAGADDWFEIGEVQLEVGSVATDFEHKPFSQTLANCQRYYTKTFPSATTPAEGLGANASNGTFKFIIITTQDVFINWIYPVQMRATPSITLFNPRSGGATGEWTNFSADSGTARTLWSSDTKTLIDNADNALAVGIWYIAATAEAEL